MGILPSAFCLLPSAFCLLPSAFCFAFSVFSVFSVVQSFALEGFLSHCSCSNLRHPSPERLFRQGLAWPQGPITPNSGSCHARASRPNITSPVLNGCVFPEDRRYL